MRMALQSRKATKNYCMILVDSGQKLTQIPIFYTNFFTTQWADNWISNFFNILFKKILVVFTFLLCRKNLSWAAGECRDSPKEHPRQWGAYLHLFYLCICASVVCICIFSIHSWEELMTPILTTPGERVVQPGEAGDEKAESSRRNSSDNDPQVLPYCRQASESMKSISDSLTLSTEKDQQLTSQEHRSL